MSGKKAHKMRRPTATGRTTNTFNLNQPPALSIGRSERPLISTHGEMIAIIVIRIRVRSLGLEVEVLQWNELRAGQTLIGRAFILVDNF